MSRDLTSSQIDRQNILNNEVAISEIQKQTQFQGIVFENKLYFTKTMVATYFDVEIRTVERYVNEYQLEFGNNGYEILKGKRLKEFLHCIDAQDAPDINVGSISNKTSQLAVFDFRAFLNVSMVMVESPAARILRQIMLDIVIDTINQKAGGSTKYRFSSEQTAEFLRIFLSADQIVTDIKFRVRNRHHHTRRSRCRA